MATKLRVLVPVKRVIDYAVRLNKLMSTPEFPELQYGSNEVMLTHSHNNRLNPGSIRLKLPSRPLASNTA